MFYKSTLSAKRLSFLLLVLLPPFTSYGQEYVMMVEKEIRAPHQLILRHDNDVLGSTDRYYTTGNFIGYRYLLQGTRYEENPEQISFFLEHEIYTPTNKLARNTENLDRPYAGFLGLSAGWSKSTETGMIDTRVLTGVTGPISGAEDFQGFFHDVGGIGASFDWFDQIENSFHINVYLDYVKEWKLLEGPWGLRAAVKPGFSVGTKDVYAQQEVAFFFGKRNGLKSSIAYNQLLSMQTELFVKLRAAYRYVNHDALLEGNLARDKSPFLVDAEPNLLIMGFDIFCRWGRNDIVLGYTYNTAKFTPGDPHMFASLSIARRL